MAAAPAQGSSPCHQGEGEGSGAPPGDAAGSGPWTGSGGAPPGDAGPPAAHPQQRQVQLVRGAEVTTYVMMLVVQGVMWQHSAAAAAPQAHDCLRLAVFAAGLAALCLPQAAWLRYRVWIIGASRLAAACVTTHQPTGEGVSKLLHQSATAGAAGGVVDWLRIAAGTRTLHSAFVGVALPQPPLAVLAQQTALMLLAAPHGAAFCRLPLLTHPFTAARLASTWEALGVLPDLLHPELGLPQQHQRDLLAAPAAQRQLHCMALLTMQQAVVGVLLPTLAAGWMAGAVTLPSPPAPARRRRLDAAGPPWRWAAAAGSAASRAWAAADAELAELCCGEGYCGLQLCVAAWLLLGNCWMLSKAAAVRSLLGPLP